MSRRRPKAATPTQRDPNASPRFVIEVANAKRNGPAYVHPGELVNGQVAVTAVGILVLFPSTDAEDTRVQLTSAQFKAYSYDLEAKVSGKYGCTRDIALSAVNPDTGERKSITFEEAAEIVALDLNDDAAALDDQARQAEEIQALADDRDEDEIAADEA